MENLKAKLARMREELTVAEEREQEAKRKTKIARERISRAQEESKGLNRKIRWKRQELEKVEDRTDDRLDRLERINRSIDQTETSRRKLERKELKEDDTLSQLESRQKSSKLFAQEAEQRYCEALNKLMMMESETSRADARLRAARRNEMCLERKLNDTGRNVGNLTRSEESKQARCDEYQEKIRRLKDKKEKVFITAEAMERKTSQLECKIRPLRRETELMSRQAEKVKKDLRELLDEMNTA